MVLADVDISSSLQRGVNEIFAFIPEFIAAVLLLIVGYFVAKIIGNIVARVLGRAGLDRTLHGAQGGDWVRRVTSSPSRLVGKLASGPSSSAPSRSPSPCSGSTRSPTSSLPSMATCPT
jgi:hypothetical protein